jgi:hypothetical protein
MRLLHRRLTKFELNDLVKHVPLEPVHLGEEHRQSLSNRFRAVSAPGHRRLDAWGVERAGRHGSNFRWSPGTARRVLGNAAVRRITLQPVSIRDAVRDELADQMVRATSGYSRDGSLAHWLASAPHPVIGLVTAEAVNWATQLHEVSEWLDATWSVPAVTPTTTSRRHERRCERAATSLSTTTDREQCFGCAAAHRARARDRDFAPISLLRRSRTITERRRCATSASGPRRGSVFQLMAR